MRKISKFFFKVYAKLSTKGKASTFGLLVGENGIRLLIGFVLSVWMARHLGSHGYGLFSYVTSFVLIFTPFFNMGIEEITIKEYVEKNEDEETIGGTSFFIRLVGGFLGIGMCLALVSYVNPGQDILILMVLLYSSSMLAKAFSVIENYFLAKTDIRKIAVFRNFIFILASGLKLLFLIWKKEWTWFIYVSSLELLFVSIAYLLIFIREGNNPFQWKFSFKLSRRYLRGGIPMLITMFMIMGVSKADQIMIKNILGNNEIGIYAVSVKLIELWQFVPLAILSAYFPSVIHDRNKGGDSYRNAKINLYGLNTGVSLGLIAFVFLVGKWGVVFIYGQEYLEAGELMLIYSWTTLFSFFSFVRMKIFIIENKLAELIFVTALIFILNIALNYFLILEYKTVGAAYASLIAYILANLIASLVNKSLRESVVHFLKSFLNVHKAYLGIWKKI